MNKANQKIDPKSFGWACAAAAALYWSFYSVGGLLLLATEIYISGFYGYTDLCGYNWRPELVRFLGNLFILSSGAGLTGWLVGSLYNFFNKISDAELP